MTMRSLLKGISKALGGVLTLPIILYQRLISPLTPPRCRYYPSCSQYALEAYRTHGAFWGTVLAGWRLLRCNPWSRGGVDKVPVRITKEYFDLRK